MNNSDLINNKIHNLNNKKGTKGPPTPTFKMKQELHIRWMLIRLIMRMSKGIYIYIYQQDNKYESFVRLNAYREKFRHILAMHTSPAATLIT